MNPIPKLRPAFDEVLHTITPALQLARWAREAALMSSRRTRVLVAPEASAQSGLDTSFRVLDAIHRYPELDFYLWSQAADPFFAGWLSPLARQVVRRNMWKTGGELFRSPADKWLRDWTAELIWPENAYLGLLVEDGAEYRGQVAMHAHQTTRLERAAATWPKLWVAWPDVAEPAPELGFHPDEVRTGSGENEYRQRKENARVAQSLRDVVLWVVCGGKYADRLQRHCTSYQVPCWVLADADNPAPEQWTPNVRPHRAEAV